MNEITISPNAVIAVNCNKPVYKKGIGSDDSWQFVSYTMGGKKYTNFPCEWTNAYGSDVILAQSQNIKELATIRMGYNPDLLAALNTTEVLIYRNGETAKNKAFEVCGSADNIKMQNKLIEFKVKRLAVKPSEN